MWCVLNTVRGGISKLMSLSKIRFIAFLNSFLVFKMTFFLLLRCFSYRSTFSNCFIFFSACCSIDVRAFMGKGHSRSDAHNCSWRSWRVCSVFSYEEIKLITYVELKISLDFQSAAHLKWDWLKVTKINTKVEEIEWIDECQNESPKPLVHSKITLSVILFLAHASAPRMIVISSLRTS